MSRLSILLVSSILLLSVSCDEKDGGWSGHNGHSDQLRIAKHVVGKLIEEKKVPENSSIAKITEFETQVVSGINYRIVFSLDSGQRIKADVFENRQEKLTVDSYRID